MYVVNVPSASNGIEVSNIEISLNIMEFYDKTHLIHVSPAGIVFGEFVWIE